MHCPKQSFKHRFRWAVHGLWLPGLVAFACACAAGAADPFAAHVRPTEPLAPDDAREAFRLPPGFEKELVASEPDIAKPMNMAFDARGRLWVTVTLEYPHPVPLGERGRDSIQVLEDTNGDGHFDKVSTFVDGLNIPIGLYPYRDGVIAWSIPNLWFFRDTDGDGRADVREKLYGPLGWERDTHGMSSSFVRGFDGWLYITHGFNNDSVVRGADGSEIRMNSGNTYRVRLDGSRVEHHTHGQVNPFGMCLDPRGNLYSADCHSSPVYQLLHGGYYPSFGKPHDGLGFAPTLMQHSHDSTAISGIVYYADDQWPDAFRDNLFIGNVMTSRINRDSVTFNGSSPVAEEMPDFLETDDPWFRPVNLQLGPDGALYVADFYNRIIGHYEVPLDHPGRDRERGRIWRVVYRGSSEQPIQPRPLALANTIPGLVKELGSPNLKRRLLAMNDLVDRHGDAAVSAVRQAVGSDDAFQRIHARWVLHRLGALEDSELQRACADTGADARVHAMRMLTGTQRWTLHGGLAVAGLEDESPHV
ncbi:MAG TPA: PVC-type heme-binding CxxCH protein, partial [Methylomirabilota bacterium]|nr:PVC-type heme-binding CxxCH protein [Methylomirabilota bacterium]